MELSTNNEATKTVKATTNAPHYLCFVTNKAYAPGAVCLAQSLHLVQSKARLCVIATSMTAHAALLSELAASPNPSSIPMDVVLEETPLPTYSHDKTHNGRGATLAVDAPRRCLFDDNREGWILLDADLIAVQNPDALLTLLHEEMNKSIVTTEMFASANFRIKKKKFGNVDEGSNFNAGMMIVPRPLSSDGVALQALVDAAGEDDTEELLMNDLFRGRCGSLARGYNVPKRVMHHAPGVWREMIGNKEIVFLHYMGAKPWMIDVAKRTNADWESENPTYKTLEKVWWKIRQGELEVDEDGTLHGSLPLEA
jgi:hypothetical protein